MTLNITIAVETDGELIAVPLTSDIDPELYELTRDYVENEVSANEPSRIPLLEIIN